jgi:hypothetical protein
MSHPLNLPTFAGANPGRSVAWTIPACAARLADAGPNGLAGWILRDGFRDDPQCLLTVATNTNKETFADLCAAILEGLDTRRTEEGAVRAVCLRPGMDGKGRGPSAQVSAIRTALASMADDVADYIIPSHGDGRERTVATILAHAYDIATGGAGIAQVHVHVKASGKAGDALRSNTLRDLANKLDPWAKVDGTVAILSEHPTMQESELMRVVGFKRGDAQLAHRGAVTILRHRLIVDRSKRCPSKEEWKEILDADTCTGAQAKLDAYQGDARVKRLGIDVALGALAGMPETATVNCRELATALASGDTLDALLKRVREAC